LYAEEEQLLGLAVVGLLVLAVIALVAIPILLRVFGEATRRNENRPGGEEGDEENDSWQ
jgi:hypothetical protein